ncbi:MAG: T9SS type A sorting domain-containing protein [Candidatus Latescibacteria bacterium]|nr:T9SS type A sorting domain-containing protein [bacterium]MBD3423973.1 T9SS type A sorting domain-containing protein [Candidatus Latescibacterota bacterium]
MKGNRMKSKALLALAIISILPLSVSGEQLRETLHFSPPQVITDSEGFSRIIFPGAVQAGKPGEPSVPYRKVQLLLSSGERVTDVRLKRSGWRKLKKNCRLYPRQIPRTSGPEAGRGHGLLMKSEAYGRDKWIYPPAGRFSTHYLRGHSVATGTVCPVGYNAGTGEAGYYQSIELVITTGPSGQSPEGEPKYDMATIRRLKNLVDNPGTASLLNQPASGGGYSYLIITAPEFEDDFSALADFYNRRGFLTAIMTMDDIETGYSGSDAAEKLRNAIIDQYTQHSITHVLLGGDTGEVPYRGLYCSVESSSTIEDSNIPSDLYFSNLDGSWNSDGDSYWGEPGEEDFYAELAVGRAPVDSVHHISAFLNKTMMYQEEPVISEIETASLFGEWLWGDPLTYGGDEMDQLIDTCSAYGFFTEGIPPHFSISKYYERDGSWDKTDLFAAFNSGTNWLAHSGHANSSYVMKMSSSYVTNGNFQNNGSNSGFPIVYTYGCYSGAFDYDQCIAEKFVIIENCASAILANSRYGWFTEGTTNGPSHHYQREFYDAIFTEGFTTLGEANTRSKDETVPFIDLPDEYEPGAHRWCFYTLNLLGDPAMDGWTDSPADFQASHSSFINRSDSVFAAETGAESALAALYWDGVCYGKAAADQLGRCLIHLSDSIPAGVDSLELTITLHDYSHYRDTIMVDQTTDSSIPSFQLSLSQNVPNPFNPSTRIDFSLRKKGHVRLTIFDIEGREVEKLVDRIMEEGDYSVDWRPAGLSSGIYFYYLKTDSGTRSRKAVLLR